MFGTGPAALAASVGEDPTLPLRAGTPAARVEGEPGPFPPPPGHAGVLVAAAWPVLCVLARLRAGAIARPDGLKEGCIAAIRRFEAEALRGGAAADLVFAGRYAICSAIDEQVLGTPWGDTSEWSAGSLLSVFHNETWGGEKVFAIVDTVLAANGAQRDLTMLLFYLLSLGFQGRFRLRRDGTTEVEALRERLFRAVYPGLGEAPPPPGAVPQPPPARGSRWRGGGRRRLRSWPPVWVVAAGSAVVGALMFVTYETLLELRAERLARALVAVDRPVPARPATALPPVVQPAAPTAAGAPTPAAGEPTPLAVRPRPPAAAR